MSGSGPAIGTRQSTRPTRRRRAAFRKIRAADHEAASYDPRLPRDQNSSQGAQRRLASVRAELLPPLPSGRAPCGTGRYVDEPRRISMRHSNREATYAQRRQQRQRNNSSLKNGASNRRNMLLASTTLPLRRLWDRLRRCESGASAAIGRRPAAKAKHPRHHG